MRTIYSYLRNSIHFKHDCIQLEYEANILSHPADVYTYHLLTDIF